MPGEVARLRFHYLGPVDGNLPVKPGTYTVRAHCSYYRGEDGETCRLESAPFTVTISAGDVRRWESYLAW